MPSTDSPPAPSARLRLGVAAALALFAITALRLAVVKSFSLDELTYAHAAWSVAQGLVPYRDFFFHHTPLLLQLGGLVVRWVDDAASQLLWLRLLVLPFVGLLCWSAFRLNRERGDLAPLLAPVLLLSTPLVATMATEIRPDPLAFALTLAATALLRSRDGGGSRRALGAGLLLGAGVWASEKVAIYGAVFLAAWALDLARNARRGESLTLRPWTFAAGAAAVAIAASVYLTISESWPDFWRWSVRWPLVHEEFYPGFSWTTYFVPYLRQSWWLLLLAALGAAETFRRVRGDRNPSAHPDLLPLGLLVSTFASFAAQKSAYPYSLIPFAVLAAVFGARGVVAVSEWIARRAPGRARPKIVRTAAAVAFGTALATAWASLALRSLDDNRYQRETLRLLGRLTAADDPIYDNSGGYVDRPHVSYFFFTDATVRRLFPGQLSREMPAAIRRAGCTVFLPDIRFPSLPAELRAFLLGHFQPYNGDVYLWGQRFDPKAGLPGAAPTLSSEFLAVRDAVYFVEPAELLRRGRLSIDGMPVTEVTFHAGAGAHRVEYEGPAESFHLLWLPRDGRTWAPRPGLEPRFSRLF